MPPYLGNPKLEDKIPLSVMTFVNSSPATAIIIAMVNLSAIEHYRELCENLGIFEPTGKKVQRNNNFAINEHFLF